MSEKLKFDITQMYYRQPFKVNDRITIYQPSVGDIIEFGENDFYNSVLNPFVTNSTSYRVMLWDNKIDWNKTSDFELFTMLYKSIGSTELLFHDFSFAGYDSYTQTIDGKSSIVLWNKDVDDIITEQDYTVMSQYIRTLFNIFPKAEKVKGKILKEEIINQDRIKQRENEKQEHSPFLLPLISSCMNHPGFKYRIDDLKDLGIFAFMDSVQRLQIYESSIALLHGAYGGFVDSSKLDKNEMNFMRSIEK